MALMMVHLLAGDRWAQRHPAYLDCPEFYYGVIAPDAIHVRDGDDKSHKDEIHLHNWQSPHPEEVVAYWRRRGEPFDVGYGVHVLTDCQWVPRYRERLPGMMKSDGRLDIGDATGHQRCIAEFVAYPDNDAVSADGYQTRHSQPQAYLTDVNRDGKRDINDVTAVQRILCE